ELGVLDSEQLARRASNCIVGLRQQINFLGNYFRLSPIFPLSGVPLSVGEPSPPVEKDETLSWQEQELNEGSPLKLDESVLLDNPVYDQWGMNLFEDSF
ncbi:MAG: hypothetical protein ACRDEA_22420, partial [Microcystaceae cyanobacterium]